MAGGKQYRCGTLFADEIQGLWAKGASAKLIGDKAGRAPHEISQFVYNMRKREGEGRWPKRIKGSRGSMCRARAADIRNTREHLASLKLQDGVIRVESDSSIIARFPKTVLRFQRDSCWNGATTTYSVSVVKTGEVEPQFFRNMPLEIAMRTFANNWARLA